jgi:hypothetical protein
MVSVVVRSAALGLISEPRRMRSRGDALAVSCSFLLCAFDVLDEMETAVIDASGRVGNVDPGTPLDACTVAAGLRFPVQRPVATDPKLKSR